MFFSTPHCKHYITYVLHCVSYKNVNPVLFKYLNFATVKIRIQFMLDFFLNKNHNLVSIK